MNFRPVYRGTVVVLTYIVLVSGIVTEGTGENEETAQDSILRSASEIISSKGSLSSRTDGKYESNTKRGLESSMAYPQGYFPLYYSSNEMQSPVTPPYNRDYDQDISKKQLYYYERPISTGPLSQTQSYHSRRPLVSNFGSPLYSNNGYYLASSSGYPNQGTFNNDRQYSTSAADGSYSGVTYRPTQSNQPVVDYPVNYPSYVYTNEPRKTYPAYTPTSYQPSYDVQRPQTSVEYENAASIPREYSTPTYSVDSHGFASYVSERQPVIEVQRYNYEPSQTDRRSTLQYQLQVLRELEEQQRKLLQEINSQTQAAPSYSTSVGIHRRMVPQFPVGPEVKPTDYFVARRRSFSQIQPSVSGTLGATFLINPTSQPTIMPTRMPYLVEDRRRLPLQDSERNNFNIPSVPNRYFLRKNKRDMEMMASTCGEVAVPGKTGDVVCSSQEKKAGHFWDYFELEKSKHLIYRTNENPSVFLPVGLPPTLPSNIPHCADINMCSEVLGTVGVNVEPISEGNEANVGDEALGMTGSGSGGGGFNVGDIGSGITVPMSFGVDINVGSSGPGMAVPISEEDEINVGNVVPGKLGTVSGGDGITAGDLGQDLTGPLSGEDELNVGDVVPGMTEPISGGDGIIFGDLGPVITGSMAGKDVITGDVGHEITRPITAGNGAIEQRPTQKFNTSCGDANKTNEHNIEEDDRRTLTTSTTTATAPTTMDNPTTTSSMESGGTESETDDVTTTDSDKHGGDTDGDKEHELDEDGKEGITFPDPMEEDDETHDKDEYNETIYRINPRELIV